MAAAGLTDAQIEEFREAFQLFDRNQDGTIYSKDLANVLKSIGQNPSDEEATELMDRFDSDGSGTIDFPEFLSLIAKIQRDQLEDRDEIKEALKVFDKDGKGVLNKDQVEYMIKNVGEELSEAEVMQILDSIKYDLQGNIDLEKLLDIIFDL